EPDGAITERVRRPLSALARDRWIHMWHSGNSQALPCENSSSIGAPGPRNARLKAFGFVPAVRALQRTCPCHVRRVSVAARGMPAQTGGISGSSRQTAQRADPGDRALDRDGGGALRTRLDQFGKRSTVTDPARRRALPRKPLLRQLVWLLVQCPPGPVPRRRD